jgi:hypothetical protein
VRATPRASEREPRYAVGTRVFGAGQGAFATQICARESFLLPVPPGWSFADAAGLFVTAPTSYGALVVRAGIKEGDWVLVHAAAGGVGLAAVQSMFCFVLCCFVFLLLCLHFSLLFFLPFARDNLCYLDSVCLVSRSNEKVCYRWLAGWLDG